MGLVVGEGGEVGGVVVGLVVGDGGEVGGVVVGVDVGAAPGIVSVYVNTVPLALVAVNVYAVPGTKSTNEKVCEAKSAAGIPPIAAVVQGPSPVESVPLRPSTVGT